MVKIKDISISHSCGDWEVQDRAGEVRFPGKGALPGLWIYVTFSVETIHVAFPQYIFSHEKEKTLVSLSSSCGRTLIPLWGSTF